MKGKHPKITYLLCLLYQPIVLVLFSLFFLNLSIKLSQANPFDNLSNTKNNQLGNFSLSYQKTSDFKKIKEAIQETQLFDQEIAKLNNSGLIFRQNIQVSFEECGTANAFYWRNEQGRGIKLCYEYIADSLLTFHEQAELSIEASFIKAINDTMFTFYHELGHALIDTLPLPTVGQEEDAVDEFAAITLLEFSQRDDTIGSQIILDAANKYLLKRNSINPSWNEHSPNEKRLFNLVCLVYGSNPQNQQYISHFEQVFNILASDLVEQQGIDVANSETKQKLQAEIERKQIDCIQQFPQKVISWKKLLTPHYSSSNRGKTPSITAPNRRNSPSFSSPSYSTPGTHW